MVGPEDPLEVFANHILELGQPVCAIVGPLQRTHVYVLDPVLGQQLARLFRVCRLIQEVHVPGPPPHVGLVGPALLLLVPLPAHYRRQACVDRDTPSPPVPLRLRRTLQDNGRALHIRQKPPNALEVGLEIDTALGVPIDRSFDVRGAVQRQSGHAVVEAVPEAVLRA